MCHQYAKKPTPSSSPPPDYGCCGKKQSKKSPHSPSQPKNPPPATPNNPCSYHCSKTSRV